MNDITSTVQAASVVVNEEGNSVNINKAVDINHFRPYDSQLPVPELKGYRTVKVIYRENKATGKKAGETSYIRIPDYITEQAVADKLEVFMPYFVSYLQGQEDEIIKELHKNGATEVKPETLTLDAILGQLENSQQSVRLNSEKIVEWFRDNVADKLADAVAAKLGVSDEPTEAELEKLVNIVSVYEKKLASLASPKTAYRPEEAEMLQKALEVTGGKDTVVGNRFYKRLEDMKTKTPDDLLLSL